MAETYQTERVEEILELFDWTGLQVRCHPISLDRLKRLLLDAIDGVGAGLDVTCNPG
jgi:hypothetical protein